MSLKKDRYKEYIEFSEMLNSENLAAMRSLTRKDKNSILNSFVNAIVRIKSNMSSLYLFKLLGTNLDNSKNFIDLQILSKVYENASYAEALSQAMGTFYTTECEEVNEVGPPDHPMVRRAFLSFQQNVRARNRQYEKEKTKGKFFFETIYNLSDLNEEQSDNREKLMALKDKDPVSFNENWAKGNYHLATLIKRLESSDIEDAKQVRLEVLRRNDISVDIKDYGFTIPEILHGLQVSQKANERYVYRAFVEANPNLGALLLILKNLELIEEDDRFPALKTIKALSNDYDMRGIEQDSEKYASVKKIIKKYNLPVHSKWLS